jgi:hypothetical protein
MGRNFGLTGGAWGLLVREAMRGSLVVLAFLLVGSATVRTVSAEELPPWGVVASPNQGSLDNALMAVDGIAANDLWAVGEYNPGVPPTATGRRTLIEHWDGSHWSIVPSPNPTWPGMDFASLEDVAVLSPTEAWAVGWSEDFASLRNNTLVLRWTGSAWRVVRSPNPGGIEKPNRLHAVAALSSNDIWAVGATGPFADDALVLHWNGSSWKVVANSCSVPLKGIVAVAADDIWAAGDATLCHYDGQQWSVVASPQPRPEYLEVAYPLQAMAATGPNDVWAVGYRIMDFQEYLVWATLIEHWNGSSWTAHYLAPGHTLWDVTAIAPDDAWVVGTDGSKPVILHFDGGAFSLVPTPAPGPGRLTGILALGPENLWAVGRYYDSSTYNRTLVVHAPNTTGGNVTGDTTVSGAVVTWFGRETGSATADPYGVYTAVDLAAGTYTFTAQYGGCTPASAQVTVAAGTTVMEDLIVDCP